MGKHQPEEYLAIRAWGVVMGSLDHYVRMKQELASKEDAPLNATFQDPRCDSGWSTLDQVTNEKNHALCENLIAKYWVESMDPRFPYRESLKEISGLLYAKTVGLGEKAPRELEKALKLLNKEL